MSLFGALQSGISGLSAQSSAMAAISDNIVNVNTVGYKNNQIAFKTLVTKQTSSSAYSSGGVQSVPRQYVDAQGLLADNSSSTAVGISGNGFFVVNQNPIGSDGLWAYTRAGDFSRDDNGYLKNTAGFYAQAWSLLPWDGNANASVVSINGVDYMKAYYTETGSTAYINDNVIDSINLRPVNLSKIGGTAAATQQLGIGANLPSDDANGTVRSVSALIYDSLGNASNMSLKFDKQAPNTWGISTSVPPGATNVNLLTKDNKVFSAAGQLEFTDIPQSGSTIKITDDATGTDYIFEFTNNPASVLAPNIAVDMTSSLSVEDFVKQFEISIRDNIPSGGRFTADGSKIDIVQSNSGAKLTIDASDAYTCVQNGAHPNYTSGVPTGIFTIDTVDATLKNSAKIDFNSTVAADYVGNSVILDGLTYTFTNGTIAASPAVTVDLAGAITGGVVDRVKLLEQLDFAIKGNANEPDRFVASGITLEISPSTTGGSIAIDFSGLGGAVSGEIRDAMAGWTAATVGTVDNEFAVDGITYKGSKIPGVVFNSDGTPKYFNAVDMAVEWANGAKDMTGEINQGTKVALKLGSTGTNDGMTGLSGSFSQNYIRQDGAKFGNYAGVHIDATGIITAVFDNGELRPIGIMPLATFTNPRGMESLTGNAWIETDNSGQALLKRSGENGAGAITSNALEQSTVDLATEFSNMIITQRAYSAAGKVITASSDMLAELMTFTR